MTYLKDNAEWIVPSAIALLALVAAVWSSISSHASKNEARLAREASEKSAEAAERSASAAEDSAKADTEQAAIARADREEAAEAVRQRPWAITQLSNSRFRVTNRGGTAFKVEVTGEVDLIIDAGARGLDVIQSGEYFHVLIAKSYDDEGDVEFSWAETEGGARRTQRELF